MALFGHNNSYYLRVLDSLNNFLYFSELAGSTSVNMFTTLPFSIDGELAKMLRISSVLASKNKPKAKELGLCR
jgi:hypothetical protein